MSNRQRLARDRLEYQLDYLILAYRRLIFITSLLLLIYAMTAVFIPPRKYCDAVPAIYLLLLSSSYNITVYSARLGAWKGTLWRRDD